MSVRLFVGNLAFDATETELREHFSAAGSPTSVRIPTDRETGKPRGFAFVDFAERSEAEEAIRRFNQQLFKGRPLAVNEAQPRGERPAGGSGGFRPAPRPAAAPRSQWTGMPLGGADDVSADDRPRRKFGPDAKPKGKGKRGGRGSGGERAPKQPMREVGGGQMHYSEVIPEEEPDDQGLDDFARWAREDAKNREEK